MGKYRFISKPFKRLAFMHSKNISNKSLLVVHKKYCSKFIKKFKKHEKNLQGLDEFQIILLQKLQNEIALSHSKTREYWLRRGPRLIMILCIGMIINIILDQQFQKDPEIFVSIYNSLIWVILSTYMLYQRLPDAIIASHMRIGHEHYNQWKKDTFQNILEHKENI